MDGVATKVSQLTVALYGTKFGVDFNPAVDRLRVVSDNGQNLRHDLNTHTTVEDNPLSTPPGGLTRARGWRALRHRPLQCGDGRVYRAGRQHRVRVPDQRGAVFLHDGQCRPGPVVHRGGSRRRLGGSTSLLACRARVGSSRRRSRFTRDKNHNATLVPDETVSFGFHARGTQSRPPAHFTVNTIRCTTVR